MGRIDKKGRKQGVFIEGRESAEHTHRDGTKGKDVYAARATYRDGKKVAEKREPGWGKIHSDSDRKKRRRRSR